MKTVFEAIGASIVAILILALIATLCGLPVMWLWNWLMPVIFGLGRITFLQAVGVFFLAGLLTKGTSSSNNKND